MATQSLEVIRRVVMEAQSKGFDKLAADLDKVAKSQEGVAATSTTVTKSQGSVDQAFARTERTLDKTMVAYQAFAKQVKAVNDAQEQGRASPERAAQLIGLADAQLQKATGSTAQFAQSTGLARHELINLGRQMQDVVVSLGSGQGLGTVLLQQGAQIGDVFASMRGTVGGALTQLAGMAVRVAPVAIALGAVATAIYAVNKAAEESREARIATTSGLGRLSGVSAEGVGGLAERGAGAGVSMGDAREGVLAFIKAGADATTIAEGMGLATRVAATRGIELGDAYKLLAGIIRDPAAAAKQLGDEYRILTDEQRKNIATLQASGDRAGAAKAVFNALQGVLVSATDATTGWANAWTKVKDAASGAADAVAKAVGLGSPPSSADQLREMQQARQRRDQAAAGEFDRDQLIRPFFAPPPSQGPAQPQGFQPTFKPTEADNEAFKQEEVIRQRTLEVTKQQTAAMKEQERIQENINKRIADSKQALDDDLRVAEAFTTEQKAAAAAVKVRNEALRAGASPKEAKAAGDIAGQRVTGMAKADAQQALAVQQAQLGMFQQLAAAAQTQGMAGVILNAQLQMEMQLRQQGLNVLLPENQARIQNAGILAQQAVALRDLAQAQQMRAAGGDQVELMRLENSLIGEDAALRAQLTTVMQGEIEARALERQGMTESAAAAREVAAAKGEEAARSVELQANLQQEAAAHQANAQAARADAQAGSQAARAVQQLIQTNASILRSQGRDTAHAESGAMHTAGGTTRASDWEQFGAGGKPVGMGISDELAEKQGIALFGAGNFSMQTVAGPGMGAPFGGTSFHTIAAGDPKKIADMRKAAQDQLRSGAQQALQSRLGLAMNMLSKHIQDLNETVAKSDELQQKLDQQEDRRQQRIQQYLAAGPSPYEQNADIYYDPKKRLLFAEQIAGSTSDLLKQQVAAAKADEAASKAQIKALEDQQQQLQDQSELLSAGVDLSQQELTALDMLIGVVRNELPANLATAYDRMQQAGATAAKKAQEDVLSGLPLAVKSGLGTGTQSGAWSVWGYNAVPGSGGGAYTGGAGGLAGGGSSSGKGAALGGFASGGAFTVPGSGAADRPFRIGLTPGERVTITPPGKRAGGGTTVERMIIQLPPGAEPIQLMNKTSRNSLSRATRRMGRMM